jgi:soluble lytic murein transglycosylase
MRRIPLLTTLVVCTLSTTVLAQQPPTDSDDPAVRAAGGEARFRVIQRFGAEPQSAIIPTVSETSPFAPIIALVQTDDWRQAHQQLSAASLSAELDREHDKAFLAAYAALQAGQHGRALELFNRIAGKLPLLDDYVQYYGAVSAHQAKNFHEAALFASRVPDTSLLYPQSLVQLADSLIAAGTADDLSRAVQILDLYLTLYPRRSDAATVRMRLADTLAGQDQAEAAANHYLTVWNEFPISSQATQARQKLEALRPRLSEATRKRFETSSNAREVRRFNALFNIHRSELLIEEIPKAIQTWDKGSEERCEGLFLVARSHTNLRRHSEGSEWYERVLTECKGSSFEIRALYLGGRGYWNAGQRDRAKALFRRIWTEYPTHSFADDAMYFTARILRDEDKPEEARKLLEDQVKRYPKDDMAKDAHWLIVREMFENKRYKDVIRYVDGLKETGEDDLYSRGRLHYFRARAQEMDGDRATATASYGTVVKTYPKTYYAFLALNRLAHSSGADKIPGDVCALEIEVCQSLHGPIDDPKPIDIPTSLRQDQAFQKGILLLSLGLTSLAQSEFQALRTRHASSPDTLWALAFLLDAARAYPLSHDIPRRHISDWTTAYPDQTTQLRWRVAFPTPFKDDVQRFARQRNLPMALVYAIMREESGFNPRVESWANARGLLQLMEQTAQNVARADGFGELTAAQLFDPTINIRLGTAYMAELSGQTGAHPALIVAGYNGGYGAVARWVSERGDLPLDLFVEDIPFGQTRNYTKRVLTSYWTYSMLYGQEKVPRLPFTVR